MKTRLILKPGQRGTKSLAKTYGDALLCVRFRYDAELRQRPSRPAGAVELGRLPDPVRGVRARPNATN